MNPYIRKISATNLFVVPILGIGREKLLKNGFEEAFIKDEIRELQYENAVFLLFHPSSWEDFNLFVEDQRDLNMGFVDEYHLPGGWAVLVYQYDKKWKKDIDIITLTGKYSKVSKEYKNLIPKYMKEGAKDNDVESLTNQHLIFNKSEVCKDYWKKELDLDFGPDDEVWLWYFEREILNMDSLKRLNNIG